MAKKDVDLVIRAKDQTGSAINNVADALRELNEEQIKVGQSADGPTSLLSQLTNEFKRLDNELKGFQALGKITTALDKAGVAIGRMEKEFAGAQQEAAELSARLEQAAAATLTLQAASAQANAALERQKGNLNETKTAYTQQTALVDKLVERMRLLERQYRAADAPSDALKQTLKDTAAELIRAQIGAETLAKALQADTVAFRASTTAANAAANEYRNAATFQERLAKAAASTADDLREQETALDQARTAYRDIEQQGKETAAVLGNIALEQESVAASARRAASDIQRVSAALAQQKGTAGKTSATTVDPTSAAGATAAFRAQSDAVDQLKAKWKEAEAVVRLLATEMRGSDDAARELNAAFLIARQTAAEASKAYDASREALQRTRTEMQAAVAIGNAFKGMLAQVTPAELEAAAAAERAAAATDRYNKSAKGMIAAFLGMKGAADQFAAATNKASAGVGTWGEHTRKALSLTQRLRGEVLSLVTAYVGLYQALAQIGGVVNAFRTLEAASSRLGVVFNQNSELVKQELRFIQQQSDRLGLSFATLSDEYSKFAVAAQAANFSLADQRRLFLAVAESARVNKVSTENLSGIYLAFTQILSKGKVSSEELRRQLGDRMAGAFNLFADALGVTTAQLDEMMRKGEVFASRDNLLKFADKLEEKFGPQLADSLLTVTTQLDRFTNNIFQAQALVGQGGFMKGLGEVVRQLNEQFKSKEGQQFFLNLGAALGNGIRLLGFFLANLDKVILAFKVFAAILAARAISGWLQTFATTATKFPGMVAQINAMTVSWGTLTTAIISNSQALISNAVAAVRGSTSLKGLGASARLAAVGTTALNVSLTVARGVLTAAAVGFRTLWTAIGGWPGAIITAATFVLGEFLGGLATDVPAATEAISEHTRQLNAVSTAYQEAAKSGKQFSLEQAKVTKGEVIGTLESLSKAVVEERKKITDEMAKIAEGLLKVADREGAKRVLELVQLFEMNRISAKNFNSELDKIIENTEDEGLQRMAGQFAALATGSREVETALGEQAAIAKAAGIEYGNLERAMQSFGVTMSVVTGEAEDLGEATRIAAEMAAKLAEARDLIKPKPSDAQEAEAEIKKIEEARDLLLNSGQLNGPGEANFIRQQAAAAIAQIRQQTDAYKDMARAAKEAADAEARRAAAIAKIKDDLAFEIAQRGRSERDQAVQSALRSARQADPNLTFGDALNIGTLAGELFDKDKLEEAKQQAEKAIKDLQQDIAELGAKAVPLTKEQFIAQLAIEKNVDLTGEWADQFKQVAGDLFDINEELRLAKKAQDDFNAALELTRAFDTQRKEIYEDLAKARDAGDAAAAANLQAQLDAITAKFFAARDAAIAMISGLSGPEAEKAIAAISKLGEELDKNNEKVFSALQLNKDLAGVFSSTALEFGDLIGEWIDGTTEFGEGLAGVRDAFLSFAADFLRKIAEMILQQAILNALGGADGTGGIGGQVAGFLNGLFGTNHKGGLAGSGPKRRANPMIFANARRFHDGGIPGLRQGEVPAILKENEEVLTEDDPRHIFNGGAQKQGDVKIVNAIDAGDFVSKGLDTPIGTRAILNFIRANSVAVNGALAGGS